MSHASPARLSRPRALRSSIACSFMATNAAGLATGALTRMSPATSVSGVPVSSAQAWAATNKSVIVWNARQLFFVKRADAEYLDLHTAYEQAVFARWIGNRAR